MSTRFTIVFCMIGIVGAILMIASIYVVWVEIDILGFTIGSLTGWEIYSEYRDLFELHNAILPPLSLICGILVLMIMIIVLLDDDDRYRKLNIALGLITSILAVFMLIYAYYVTQKTWEVMSFTVHLYNYLRIGFWMTVTGSVIAFLGGFIPFLKNVKDQKELASDDSSDITPIE